MRQVLVSSAVPVGIAAKPVTIVATIHSHPGPLEIFGSLPESTRRYLPALLRAALASCQFSLPSQMLTLTLDSPPGADTQSLTLPLALAILAATEQLPSQKLEQRLFCGDLDVSGHLLSFRGTLACSEVASSNHLQELLLPSACAPELELLRLSNLPAGDTQPTLRTRFFENLPQVVHHLLNGGDCDVPFSAPPTEPGVSGPDLSLIHGQEAAKRALTIAAAGAHSLLLVGPPGASKTLLARSLPTILPPLDPRAAAILTKVYSYVSAEPSSVLHRPFRAPHTGSSEKAFFGGGSNPRPGEVSLAHEGILFLDDLLDFRSSLTRSILHAQTRGSVPFRYGDFSTYMPADFQLVAATTPCHCGHYRDPRRQCTCSPLYFDAFQSRLNRHLDMFHLLIRVNPPSARDLSAPPGETSQAVASRVAAARAIQHERGRLNAHLQPEELELHCRLAAEGHEMRDRAYTQLGLTPKTLHHVLRVARTIADLELSPLIRSYHLAEALQYRSLS